MSEEFDQYAASYKALLKDPIRDKFSADGAFFAKRKWILIQDFFSHRKRNLHEMAWLDIGCGQGELLTLGKGSFGRIAGCDMSAEMLAGAQGLDVTLQTNPECLPYADQTFDFVTAVCVFHHVEPSHRDGLVREMVRLLKPGGVVGILEHNPLNPATRLIVSRTPVDQNAILLMAGETEKLLHKSGLSELESRYFLYLPESLYPSLGWIEPILKSVPLGGQYATFGWNSEPRKADVRVY